MGGIAKRLLARLGIWRSDDLVTVPPELSACEFDCVKTECDEGHFDVCKRRLRTAAALRAEDDRQAAAAAGVQSEPCVAPPLAANDVTSAPATDLSAAR